MKNENDDEIEVLREKTIVYCTESHQNSTQGREIHAI